MVRDPRCGSSDAEAVARVIAGYPSLGEELPLVKIDVSWSKRCAILPDEKWSRRRSLEDEVTLKGINWTDVVEGPAHVDDAASTKGVCFG